MNRPPRISAAAAAQMYDALRHIVAAFEANDSHGIREEIENARTILLEIEGNAP